MSDDKGEARLRRSGFMRIVQVFLILLIQLVIFFLSAGRVDIPRAWLYFSLSTINLILNFVIFYRFAPEIINQRGEVKKDTKRWDKVFSAAYTPLFLLLPAIAGLDIGRYEWSSLGIGYAIVGALLYLPSAIVLDWAMITNTHFETTVRIQKDRDHKVVSDGPYGVVRHPGYVALILSAPTFPLIIGSAYALIPAGIMMLLLSIRTYFEDKTLQLELDGYSEYAKKVKYRLLPGVW
ncbi:MAG: isoprenylcysteine carboxylmethyltransferase family protein [Halobacteriota archaeon]|nr:isoprenylcysteine carboxylmethyltransferase family protein [Halobacteriota archaeon]